MVELQENGRKKRRTASADNWTPENGEILISFSKDPDWKCPQPSVADPVKQRFIGPKTRQLLAIRDEYRAPTGQKSEASEAPATESKSTYLHPRAGSAASTLRQAASHAGADSGLEAREEELCRILDEAERQGRAFIALKWFRDEVLPTKGLTWATDADERQAVLAAAIEKRLIVTSRVPNPRSPFPTTAIRLSRAPATGAAGARRYAPVRIQGEPLSSTILHERGSH